MLLNEFINEVFKPFFEKKQENDANHVLHTIIAQNIFRKLYMLLFP